MSIKIGDIDIAAEIVDLKYQLIRTQMIIDALIEEEPKFKTKILKVIEKINQEALRKLQEVYPNMGIKQK